jgi:microcystin-dependent protein
MSYYPVRPGTIVDYGGGTVPYGYLLCNGTSYSTTATSPNSATNPLALLAVMAQSSYPFGGGGTSFSVPNFQRRTSVGSGGSAISGSLSGTTVGSSGGEEVVTLATSQIPSHTHNWGTSGGSGGTFSGSTTSVTDQGIGSHTHETDPNGVILTNLGGGNQPNAGAGDHVLNGQPENATGGPTSIAHEHTYNGSVGGTTDNGTGGNSSHDNYQPSLIVTKMIKW